MCVICVDDFSALTACEGERIELRCPRTQFIAIRSAVFGWSNTFHMQSKCAHRRLPSPADHGPGHFFCFCFRLVICFMTPRCFWCRRLWDIRPRKISQSVSQWKQIYIAPCVQSESEVRDVQSRQQRRCLGGAVVERWTRDRKVAGSTPGRGAIKSTRTTQPSIPPG